ncbi:MAG: S8 family serine peptidase [Phycisphaerales bacterium]
MRSRIVASFSLLALASLAIADAQPRDPSHAIVFDGQRVPLTLDPARLAALGLDAAPGERVTALGLDGGIVESAHAGGWVVVKLPDAAGENTLRDAIRAAEPGVFLSPVFVGEGGGPVIPTRDVLVRFAENVDRAARRAALDAAGLTPLVEDWAGMPGAYKARSDARNGLDVLGQTLTVAAAAPVVFAEPDMLFTGSGGLIPNDSQFNLQWGMRNTGQSGGVPGMDVNAAPAWDVSLGSSNVRVLVIDTGVDPTHPDLVVAAGADFTNDPGAADGAPVNEWDVHGTAVAGCITALLNGQGVVGVAPNASLYSARPFISNGNGSGWDGQSSWTVEALAWAQSEGVRVTNNSNRYGFVASGAITTIYAQTRDAGMVHFASGGNEFDTQLSYPARLSTVNGVAAVNRQGQRADFSNQSSALAFAGPGVSVRTTDISGNAGYVFGDWVYVDGTSFASPIAAGVAALMLSERPALTPTEVEWIMQSTALDLEAPGFDVETGWGMVRAYPAVVADLPAPRPFERLLPADDTAENPRASVLFGWQTATWTLEYDLRIFDADTQALAHEVTGLTTTATQVDLGVLAPGRRYVWEAVARSAGGETLASAGPSMFVVTPLADISGDCVVNFDDLNRVLAVFGQSGPFAEAADLNENGVVDFADLNEVLAAYGQSCN